MRLTRGSDYGILGMLYLAQRPDGEAALVQDVAQSQHISPSYLAKIFQDLARNGLIHSRRGVKGGSVLARPPEEITLRQAIEAVQGPIAVGDCMDPGAHCELAAQCCLRRALTVVQRRVLEMLDGITLGSLLDDSAAQGRPQQQSE